jgi:hypothetical protein
MNLEQNFWEICKNDANRPVMRFTRIISETIRRQFEFLKDLIVMLKRSSGYEDERNASQQ